MGEAGGAVQLMTGRRGVAQGSGGAGRTQPDAAETRRSRAYASGINASY